MKIRSTALTHCGLVADGRAVAIDLVDDQGADVAVELSLEQAQAIAKTLPCLLERASRAVSDKTEANRVLALDRWTVERSIDGTGLLLTLTAGDGYEVCFAIPGEACRGLGLVLGGCKRPATEDESDRTPAASSKPLN